jgi:hypothetical protein
MRFRHAEEQRVIRALGPAFQHLHRAPGVRRRLPQQVPEILL